jgi:hypothetical protein
VVVEEDASVPASSRRDVFREEVRHPTHTFFGNMAFLGSSERFPSHSPRGVRVRSESVYEDDAVNGDSS